MCFFVVPPGNLPFLCPKRPHVTDCIFVDVKALRDHLFKALPHADEKPKVYVMIIPMSTNSRGDIS